MNIFTKLFGNDNIVEKGVDAVVSTGDKLALTKEERLDYHLIFLKAYEPFKIAQRFLALIVGIPYVLVFLTCVITYLFGGTATALAIGQLNQDTLGGPFWTIIGFYFAGGMIEGGVKAWKGEGKK